MIGVAMPQLDILYHQINPPVPGMLYLLESLTRGVPWNLPKHRRLLPVLLLSLYNLIIRPYCKDNTYLCHRTLGEVELVPSWKLHPSSVVFLALEGTLNTSRAERWSSTSPSFKSCSLQQWPACRTCWCNSGTRVTGITNHLKKKHNWT